MMDAKTHMTLNELAAAATAALGDVDQASGRVSDILSVRTIRFYSTHGLLDRPLEFKGRTAIYGLRHLQQLVAIKRLQSRGYSLEDVQDRVVGATDEQLRTLSELDVNTVKSKRVPTRSNFWSDLPDEDTDTDSEGAHGMSSHAAQPASDLAAVRLDEAAVLLIENLVRDIHPDDVEAIRVAAGPLLKLLQTRNLIDPRS